MNPNDITGLGQQFLTLHLQLSQLTQFAQAQATRIEELEALNNVLQAKLKELKKATKKVA